MEILFEVRRFDTKEIVGLERINESGHWEHIRPNRDEWLLGAITDGQEYSKFIRRQFIGITDSEDIKIFSDDLRITEDGTIFRIYSVPGGFAIKAPYWMSDINDLVRTDELILSPIADPQTKSWLISSTKHFGNIHEKTSS